MLGGLVGAGTKALGGERFSLVSVLPTTLLVGYVAFLAASGLYSRKSVSLGGIPQTVAHSAGWAVLAVFAVFVISVLLRPLQLALVWMLEGYWGRTPVLKWIEPLAVERHCRRRHTATVIASQGIDGPGSQLAIRAIVENRRRRHRQQMRAARARERIARYPSDRLPEGKTGEGVEVRLMPTMLGNALRKAEDDAGDRYGLDFTAIAVRLYPQLSDKLSTEIARNLDVIESGSALTAVFGLAAAASVPLCWRDGLWFLSVPLALGLCALAYAGTLRAARDHAVLLATAVDLHRFDTLAKLHYKLPTTAEDERGFNLRLSAFILSLNGKATEYMASDQYVHAAPTQPPTPPPVVPVAADGVGNGAAGSTA